MEATAQSDIEVRDTILTMGADNVVVVRDEDEDGMVMYVAFYRHGGCGRIYINVCSYLAKRFPDMKIVVLESPRVNSYCTRARVRKAGGDHFVRGSVHVTPERLGMAA